jgi:hypothetical protein
MNFIKKVFDETIDDSVHLQFQKFGKGEFRDRALVKVKKTGSKYTITTSSEFTNDLVRVMAEKLRNNKTQVTGAIVSTSDLKGELEFKEIKQFQGVKRYLIDNEMSGEEILNLLNKFPKVFFALSFSAEASVLKIKPKGPKTGKPKNKEEAPKPDFCKLITNNEIIAKAFVFEKINFNLAEINHVFLIEQIIIPEELKQEKDFAKVREMAKRKGKIIRKAIIDSQEIKTEKEFIA